MYYIVFYNTINELLYEVINNIIIFLNLLIYQKINNYQCNYNIIQWNILSQ